MGDFDEPSRSRVQRKGEFGQARRRGGGSKLARSETVTVRLDPKLRYLAELASRKQRRTLSSFIEWAIEESLKGIHFQGSRDDEFGASAASVAAELWDVDEPDRFAKLALHYPDMLTHEEQVLWKLVRENGYFWKGHYDTGTWKWRVAPTSLNFERLREHWAIVNAVARGDADVSALPSWQKKKRSDLGDDEIPF
jgi:hypothetical protein